jgi:putative oxidoreductase
MGTRTAPYLYALLRIIGALLYACHGAQKLLGLFGGVGGHPGATVPLVSLLGLAGIIELAGGLLIACGVLTRPAAFIASGEMACAYWLSHAPRNVWPIRNGGEVAVLNCFLFLYIVSQGTGPWSYGGGRRRACRATTPGGAAAHGAPGDRWHSRVSGARPHAPRPGGRGGAPAPLRGPRLSGRHPRQRPPGGMSVLWLPDYPL